VRLKWMKALDAGFRDCTGQKILHCIESCRDRCILHRRHLQQEDKCETESHRNARQSSSPKLTCELSVVARTVKRESQSFKLFERERLR